MPAATAGAGLAGALSAARPAVPAAAGRTVYAIGTYCSLLVTAASALSTAERLLGEQLADIDRACSRFRPDSELAAVNSARGRRMQVSPLLAEALGAALRAARVTDGDVDPTCGSSLVALGYDRDYAKLADDTSPLPGPAVRAAGWRCVELDPAARTVRVPDGVVIDLGATAKALAADRAAAAIFGRAGCGVLVNLGGDIAMAGPAPRGGWPIGIDDGLTGPGRPFPGPPPAVGLKAGGLATSTTAIRSWRRGDRRLHHILVPGTGLPAGGYWAAASVAAASCVDANIASTAAIIRGGTALGWLDGLGLPARLVRPGGEVVTTGGWPR